MLLNESSRAIVYVMGQHQAGKTDVTQCMTMFLVLHSLQLPVYTRQERQFGTQYSSPHHYHLLCSPLAHQP